MTLAELVIFALAVWEAVEVWHHSSLTAGWRGRAEVIEGWRGKVLTCPFCLSVWVALLVLLIVWAGEVRLYPPSSDWAAALAGLWAVFFGLARWLVYALAVARLANVGNDLCHRRCRTPRENSEVPAFPPGPGSNPVFREQDGEKPT